MYNDCGEYERLDIQHPSYPSCFPAEAFQLKRKLHFSNSCIWVPDAI